MPGYWPLLVSVSRQALPYPYVPLLTLLLIAIEPSQAAAVIFGGETQTCDFTDPKTSAGVTAQLLTRRANGELVFRNPSRPGISLRGPGLSSAQWSPGLIPSPAGLSAASHRALGQWIEGESFHVGSDARPLTGSHLWVELSGSGLSVDTNRPTPFVRYSTTGKKWSDWVPVPQTASGATKADFSGQLEIPEHERSQYMAAFHLWAYPENQPSPFTGANNHVFYQWLQNANPGVLEREIPLVRLLQIRVELPAAFSGMIERMEIRNSWAVSGIRQ